MIIAMVASLFILVMLITKLLGYSDHVEEAQKYYEAAQYEKAFSEIDGLEAKNEEDEAFFNKVTIMATVESQYNTYLSSITLGNEEAKIDSLISAAGRWELNQKSANEFGCSEEYIDLKNTIANSLEEGYGMTIEDALSIYKIRSRIEYTKAIHVKLRDLGLE